MRGRATARPVVRRRRRSVNGDRLSFRPSTAAEALQGAVDAIAAAGSDTARLDAELLLAEATGWERAQIAADPDARLPERASREFAGMVRRRVRRAPVAYILGRQ